MARGKTPHPCLSRGLAIALSLMLPALAGNALAAAMPKAVRIGEVSVTRTDGDATSRLELRDIAVDLAATTARVHVGRMAGTRDGLALPSLWLDGTLDWGGDTLAGNAVIATARKEALLRLALRHDPKAGKGSLRLTVPRIAFGDGGLGPKMQAALLPAGTTITSGGIEFDGTIGWGAAPEGGTLILDRLDLSTPFGTVKSLAGVIELESLWPPRTKPDQALGAGLVDVGVPLTSALVAFSLDDTTIDLDHASLSFADGKLSVAPRQIDLAALTGRFRLDVTDLALEQLLEVLAIDDLEGTGVFDGELPVSMEDDGSIWVNGGKLVARSGGVIRYGASSARCASRTRAKSLQRRRTRCCRASFHSTDARARQPSTLLRKTSAMRPSAGCIPRAHG